MSSNTPTTDLSKPETKYYKRIKFNSMEIELESTTKMLTPIPQANLYRIPVKF